MKKKRRKPAAAADAYSNPAAFLGEASPLLSAGTFIRSGLTGNPELLTAMYRESWLTMRIIDMPSDLTKNTRHLPERVTTISKKWHSGFPTTVKKCG